MLSERIRRKALSLGFDLAGVTDAEPLHIDYLNHLLGWLDAGYAGEMTWMHKNLEKRINPAKLLAGAKSVIVVGLNYKPPLSLRAKQTQPFGHIAAYAHYEDYHPFIKKQLRKLVDYLIEITGPGLKFQICVDSSPLLERALAVKAGLGFIGKNHMLTNPRFGPQIFLGEVITNLEIELLNGCGHAARPPEADKFRQTLNAADASRATGGRMTQPDVFEGCQSCNKCLSACPTGALRPDGSFDATKCISYLTIEANTEIPSELTPKIGNRLFGCSECVHACPFQQNAPTCANRQFAFYPDRAEIDLNEVLNLTENHFQIRFADSPILRPGLGHLKQVAQICLNNLNL